MLSHVFGAVDKTSSSFSAHGKIGNFIIINDVRVADDVYADDNNEYGVIDVDDVAKVHGIASSSPTGENKRVANTTQLIMEQREDDSLSNC